MLLKEDFNTHLYAEVINTISREEEDLINEAIEAAEAEAISYLERFDTEDLFNKEEDDRDKILLLRLKDIAVWHFLAVASPDTDLEYRSDRYKSTIKWLEKIQAGKITPKGWVLSSVVSANQPFTVTSQPKRITNY